MIVPRISPSRIWMSVRPRDAVGDLRLPVGGWWRRDDWWPIIAGNRVRQLPGGDPRPRGPAARVAAAVGHRELRAPRREVEGAAVVDADGADVAGDDVSEG